MVSIRSLFEDVTYISDRDSVRQIEQAAFAENGIAVIDWDEDLGFWVFHTLFPSDGSKSVKPVLASKFDFPEERKNEKAVEDRLVDLLIANGDRVLRQVRCAAGIADVVTDSAIYEVKINLSRDTFFSALGQVVLYRGAIDPGLRPVIVAESTDSIDGLVEVAQDIGVSVLIIGEG